MPRRAEDALRDLRALRTEFGRTAAREKVDLIGLLERRRLPSPDAVAELHDTLLFIRAFPDDRHVEDAAESALAGFGNRGDLGRFHKVLEQTGIAGTRMVTAFSYPMARWLARRRPGSTSIVWEDWPERKRLDGILRAVSIPSELQAAEDDLITLRDWVEEARPRGVGDYATLVGRFEKMRAEPRVREDLFNLLNVYVSWSLGEDDPDSATLARWPVPRPTCQKGPLDMSRPDLRRALREPVALRRMDRRAGVAVADLARVLVSLRDRELEAFDYADPGDAWIADAGRGLLISVVGLQPDWRLFPEALYGGLMIRNGVIAGYWLATALFGSSEVAYNVSPAFRRGDSAWVYGRILATLHQFLDVDAFSVDRYQFGFENEEAIGSGAFWFYQKLGFRPQSREIVDLMKREEARIRRRRGYRSPPEVLRRLAEENIVFHAGRPRDGVIGVFPYRNLSHVTTRYLARHGVDPREGLRRAVRDVERRLGVRGLARWTAPERRALERWAPAIASIGALDRWPLEDRRGLARILRAKGGRSEREFVRLSNRHHRLRRAVQRLCLEEETRLG